jgi:hypothetical protein
MYLFIYVLFKAPTSSECWVGKKMEYGGRVLGQCIILEFFRALLREAAEGLFILERISVWSFPITSKKCYCSATAFSGTFVNTHVLRAR